MPLSIELAAVKKAQNLRNWELDNSDLLFPISQKRLPTKEKNDVLTSTRIGSGKVL